MVYPQTNALNEEEDYEPHVIVHNIPPGLTLPLYSPRQN